MDICKTREKLISVLDHYGVRFDPNKDRQMVICPHHDDHTPSLSMVLDGGYFKCFAGCGQGDLFAFVAMMEEWDCKTEFPKVLAKTKEILGIIEKEAEKMFVASHDYVVDGVVINTKNKYSNGDGKTYAWKTQKSEGGQFPIYNIDALKTATQIVIAEGEKDCDTLVASGITAISFPHGAGTVSDEHITALMSLKTVYIAYDNDEAGEIGRDKIIALLKGKGFSGQIFVVQWIDKTPGYDVTDWFNETTGPDKADSFFKLFQEDKLPAISNKDFRWPQPLSDSAFYGLAGEIVRAIEPNTEADNATLLGHFLVMFGNVIGRHPHFIVEGSKHFTNLYLMFLGETSRGRKGSAFSQLKRMFSKIDLEWVNNNIERNCSTGEGIVNRVRDAQIKKKEIMENGVPSGKFQEEVLVNGIEDKRLLLVEEEFASFLKLATREGNNLSAIVRMAWDSGDLGILTKHDPLKAKNAHISLITHITRNELLRYLTTTETCNGFANRFIWICSKRTKLLPHGGTVDPVSDGLIRRLHYAIEWAQAIEVIPLAQEARQLWENVYPTFENLELSELAEAVTSRGEAQTRRLAMIYAILDMSSEVKKVHLLAALEFWRYCEDSVKYIFDGSWSSTIAEKIKNGLKISPKGLTRSGIFDLLGRNHSKATIEAALNELSKAKIAGCKKTETGGRPEERWFYIGS